MTTAAKKYLRRQLNSRLKSLALLLLVLGPTIQVLAQSNKPCYGTVYAVTDTLPVLISSIHKLRETIASEITIPDSLQNQTGEIGIKYVINCRGEIVNMRVIKMADYDHNIIANKFEALSEQIIKIVRRDLKWTPARHHGRTVDFLQIFSIYFRNGEIAIKVTAT